MHNLEQSLQETSAQSPDRLAVEFRNQRFTYGTLAKALQAMDQKMFCVAGMRVVLLLPDGIPAYLSHLFFFLRGAVVVPMTIQTTTSKLKTLCDRVHPHFVVTNHPLRSRHAAALESLPTLLVKSGDADVAGGFDFEIQESNKLADNARSARGDDGLRLIVFTSGSTGEPKGVCLGASTILAAAGMNVSFLGLDPSRKSLATVPLYDYYGFIQIYSHILARTGYVFGESAAFPDSIFEKILAGGVTDLVLVPHTLRKLLKAATGERREAMRKLQYMTSSSDLLTPELLKDAFETNSRLKIFNIYGLTEAGRACYRVIEASSPPSNSIGRAAPGVEITIEGSNGEPGEIIIRGPNVMMGYFQGIQDDLVTLKTCTEMRTGDLGYYNERDEIELLGRRDHMFNIKGEKIHPAEIERIAVQAPGVADAQARTSADTNGDIFVLLDVVPGNGAFDIGQVNTYVRKHLSPAFFPREIRVVPDLRRTELGSKIIRRQAST